MKVNDIFQAVIVQHEHRGAAGKLFTEEQVEQIHRDLRSDTEYPDFSASFREMLSFACGEKPSYIPQLLSRFSLGLFEAHNELRTIVLNEATEIWEKADLLHQLTWSQYTSACQTTKHSFARFTRSVIFQEWILTN